MVFTAVGSPQKHGQRDQYLTPEDNWRYGVKHNKDWGYYTKDGERQVWNMRNNYYHKPHIALNDYLTLSDKTTIAADPIKQPYSCTVSKSRGMFPRLAGKIPPDAPPGR